ncbi:MAG: carbon starvation CstA family protein [Eubacterium ventriosum]
MSGILMMVIAIVVLGGAYLLYGRYLQNKWGIDPNAKTPAYEMEDGVDYVPADTNVVFGHQFASIAGAGPINGPIQADYFWMVTCFALGFNWWCFLRSSSGFCFNVCIS